MAVNPYRSPELECEAAYRQSPEEQAQQARHEVKRDLEPPGHTASKASIRFHTSGGSFIPILSVSHRNTHTHTITVPQQQIQIQNQKMT